ncbi:MAG: hypothetical protein MPW15_26155 [Candidatus Manganitrophus sp.]|nr:hypothetical protein [Candidatus Manganitrophus sp.]
MADRAGVACVDIQRAQPQHRNAEDEKDFGLKVEQMLNNQTNKYFGFKKPWRSPPETTGPYRTSTQSASDQVLLAKGLEVEYLTRNAGDLTDMMAFFPESNLTHLITPRGGERF